MRTLVVAAVALPLLLSQALPGGAAAQPHAAEIRPAILAQASPSPTEQLSPGPTASPSPGAEDDRGGIGTGAGLVIAAVLIGGLLLMRSRLLRR